MPLPGKYTSKPKRRKFEEPQYMLADDQHNYIELPAKQCDAHFNSKHSPSSSLPHLSPQLSTLWPFPTYSKGPADRFSELSSFVQSCSHLELVHLTAEILPLLKRDFLAHLPYEVVQKVLRYLPPKDLLQCAKVSRAWRHVSEDTLLWQALCQRLQSLSELGNDLSSNYCPFDLISASCLSGSAAPRGIKKPGCSVSPSTLHSAPTIPWKKLFLREKHIECNWRHGVVAKPKVLHGHHNHVITCLEVYKDWAISGSDDSSICVWDLTTGAQLTSLFGHIGGVWSMIVLPPPTRTVTAATADDDQNGTDSLDRVPLLVSGSTDRTARIWRLDNNSWACVATLFGHHSTVRCLASKRRLPPQRKRSWDKAGDSTSLYCRQMHKSHEACQQHLSLQHDNSDSEAEEEQVLKATDRLFVSGSRDTTLRLWNARTGQCVLVLRGHRGAVRCVQFCGLHIVSGSYDCTVRVWCAISGACLQVLRHHADRVYTLLFDGLRVISGSLDTRIRVWNINTGDLEQTFTGHQSLTSEMALDVEQGRLISSNADETIRAWNISTGECVHILAGANKHQSAVTCVQMTHNFIVSSSDDGTVKLWDRDTGEYLRDLLCLDTFGSGGVVWRIVASPTRLVCAAGSRCGSEATKLVVFDFAEPISSEHRCQTQHLISPPLCLSQLLSSTFVSTDRSDSHRQRRPSSGMTLLEEIEVDEPRDPTRRRTTTASPRFNHPPPHLSPSP
uniref:F-box/WD repeat-containing protein 7 n=1 Tax=Schistocephalus solidus TaxID=70667 RepID=A0A0X3PGV6_SCHSO